MPDNIYQTAVIGPIDQFQINSDFSFKLSEYYNLQTHVLALKDYQTNKRDYYDWIFNNNIPIFLDTNVLLGMYAMSSKQREELFKFLKVNKGRIYVPHQVSKEYVKHRREKAEGLSNTYRQVAKAFNKTYDNTLHKIDTLFDELDDFINNSDIIQDLGDSIDKLTDLRNNLKKALTLTKPKRDKIEADRQTISEQLNYKSIEMLQRLDYEYNDPVLEVIGQLNILNPLTLPEEDYLKARYSELLAKFNEVKEDKLSKEKCIFPGCGDRRKKQDGLDPTGDFIIYHEILKFMKTNNMDVIFLTKDITKSDWVKPPSSSNSEYKPFVSYIVDSYANTSHSLYIIHATQFLSVSMEPVISEDAVQTPQVDSETVASKESVVDAQTDSKDISNAESKDVDDVLSIISQDSTDWSDFFDRYLRHKKAFSTATWTLNPTNRPIAYNSISKDRFISELKTALKWAEAFGDGYVSEQHFIYNILGDKGFQFSESKKVLEDLINGGIIARNDEKHHNKKIYCLSFIHSKD